MSVDDMIFISVDDHVVEPPNVFDGRLPAKYADVAPKVVHTDSGNDVWVFDGQTIPNIGLNAVAGRPKEEYGVNPTSFDEMRPGCYDVNERVKDMSAGGVLACMCFPSFPSFSGRLFANTDDKDLALAVTRAYNDWHIDEWCGTHPGRFIPMALPVLWDPELCAAEIRRVAAKGCHALTFTENPAALGLPSFHDAHWDPVWRALVDEGTVLNVHLGSSGKLAITAPDAPMDVMITLQPMNICMAAADLVWSRVFKEFPTLRVALSEGGTGWIPYFLDRLDRTYDMHHLWTGQDFGDRCRPTSSASTSSRASSPTRSASRCATRSASTTSAGSRTTRTPIRRGRSHPRSSSGWRRATTCPRRPRQDHARERDALVPVRSVRASRARALHGERAARVGRGPRRVDPSDGPGAASRASPRSRSANSPRTRPRRPTPSPAARGARPASSRRGARAVSRSA